MAWSNDDDQSDEELGGNEDEVRAKVIVKKLDEDGGLKVAGLHEIIAADDMEMSEYELKDLISQMAELHQMDQGEIDQFEVFQSFGDAETPSRLDPANAPEHPTDGMILELRPFIEEEEASDDGGETEQAEENEQAETADVQ